MQNWITNLGGILDFASMRKEGTNLQDATVKDLCKCNLARKFKEKMIKSNGEYDEKVCIDM